MQPVNTLLLGIIISNNCPTMNVAITHQKNILSIQQVMTLIGWVAQQLHHTVFLKCKKRIGVFNIMRKKDKRNKELVRVRDLTGMSFTKLGKIYGENPVWGMRKQAAHRIYKREKEKKEG